MSSPHLYPWHRHCLGSLCPDQSAPDYNALHLLLQSDTSRQIPDSKQVTVRHCRAAEGATPAGNNLLCAPLLPG